MDAMACQAKGKDWEHRVKKLRNASEFTDTVYQL
jgi:hypothetical protein